MIDKKLLDILCCPETRQDVSIADGELVKTINERIAAGELLNRGGKTVRDKIDAGLVREDKAVLYPVREGIPIMLVEEAIALEVTGETA